MWQFVVDIQRDIYLGFADHIKAFASGAGWRAFLAFLPMGIAFGAVHAMTPGHSKSILATYLAGSSLGRNGPIAELRFKLFLEGNIPRTFRNRVALHVLEPRRAPVSPGPR